MNICTPPRSPRLLCSLALAARLIWLAPLLGCGGADGPTRYQVSGTVTYQGDPIPAGAIVFEPDAERGNAGPAAAAVIEQGRYATELGAVGGPHRVRITGNDGAPQGEGPEGFPMQGKSLFPEYHTTVDLPHADETWNIEVESHQP